jgi:hypothetical protein
MAKKNKLNQKEFCQNNSENYNGDLLGGSFSSLDKTKLIHKLELNQIELEIQNEELLKAKQQADSAIKKYTDYMIFHHQAILLFLKKE